MKNGLAKTEPDAPLSPEATEPEARANVLLLGGLTGALPRLAEPLAAVFSAQDLLLCALHDDAAKAAESLREIGAGVVSLAGMCGERVDSAITALGKERIIGAGETEALASAPAVCCINDVRIGVLAYGERRWGGFDGRADILGLKAFEHVRMLLNRCDHVIVLLRAGLDGAALPLPEWRARYRRFIDAGASVVADTGGAKGWETYKTGLVCYGLGQPCDGDSLLLSLALKQNGKFEYEIRALEHSAGALGFSSNGAFRKTIDDQNRLYLNEAAYLQAANQMCLRYYREHEQPQKQGLLGALLPGRGETPRRQQERLFDLLGDESRRLTTLRALRQLQAGGGR